jgi:hypothetical protein
VQAAATCIFLGLKQQSALQSLAERIKGKEQWMKNKLDLALTDMCLHFDHQQLVKVSSPVSPSRFCLFSKLLGFDLAISALLSPPL